MINKKVNTVSVPYEITLLSNSNPLLLVSVGVSVPYEITLLSNISSIITRASEFQYLMKLHYSQTKVPPPVAYPTFQYLMKLHYSQTVIRFFCGVSAFQYLMKLHYSQTGLTSLRIIFRVSVPYEITLLSNRL